MNDTPDTQAPPPQARAAQRLMGWLKALLPLAVIVGAAVLLRTIMLTAPEASRTRPERQSRLVEVVLAERYDEQVRVVARGVVKPAFDVTLTPQVSGEVVEISDNLLPGGHVRKGELLLRLDPRDYEYAVQQRESELIRARASLTLEQGQQDVALHEYEVLGQELTEADKALVFREPQLQTAKGDIAAAEAMLRDAKLDLERTAVTAPFDALVVSENVDLGSRLTSQSTIARLVGTETYWVELSVPQVDLRWVDLPTESTPGSPVFLRHPNVWEPYAFREGRIIRLLPDLSDQGRMARLLVEVDDPLGLKAGQQELPRLLISQYLEAEILGAQIDGAIRVDRNYLREGDNVWIMNDEDKLEVRPLTIAYRGPDAVLATSGIVAGERIVTTDLAAAASGMPLRTDAEIPMDDSTEQRDADS